ncbi:MAG: 50S ribosomal protein L15 [Armatimonadetes bacterium]|nr:50S ribosomal protein L15 [Armatimonadota bacterium]
MRLSDLRPGTQKQVRKRIGRGVGSGQGVTAGKGTKGQKARGSVRPGFEGGQTPLHRRLPHYRGFNNRFKKVYAIVNLDQLDRFDTGMEIGPEMLIERGVIKKLEDGLKVLADGEITKALTVRAHKFSKAAEEKIKAAGGTAEVIQ